MTAIGFELNKAIDIISQLVQLCESKHLAIPAELKQEIKDWMFDSEFTLEKSFELRKQEIARKNKASMITKLAQFEIDTTLNEQNFLMPINQAYGIAVKRFDKAKEDGKIDELNSLKEV